MNNIPKKHPVEAISQFIYVVPNELYDVYVSIYKGVNVRLVKISDTYIQESRS